MNAAPLIFGSLFAGVRGLNLGLERAGMVCKWQVEKDGYAKRVLEKHWPDVRRHDDVCTFPPAGEWGTDLICGGFPCQDISFAGKGAGLAGERSGLWSEFARIVRVLRPRFVVVENVAALLGRGLGAVLGDLAASGFDAEWDCFPASAFGADHERDRIFVIADAIGPTERFGGQQQLPQSLKTDRTRFLRARRGRNDDGISNRVDRVRCVGNAVVPQVAQWIGQRIIESINLEKTN